MLSQREQMKLELPEALKVIKEQNAAMDALNSRIDAMDTKNAELLAETKAAKATAKAEAETALAAQAAKDLTDGNFEQLHKTSQDQLEVSRADAAAFKKQLADMQTSNDAANHAREVNSYGLSFEPVSDHALRDLTQRLATRTRVVSGVMKVLDKDGNLTVSSLADLKTEILASGEVSHLVKGNQSSGGNALGGGNNSAGGKKFNELTGSELKDIRASNPQEYDRLLKEFKA